MINNLIKITRLPKKREIIPPHRHTLKGCLIVLGENPDVVNPSNKYIPASRRRDGDPKYKSSGTIFRRYGSLDILENRINELYRQRIKELHPDAGGDGNPEEITLMVEARRIALKILKKTRIFGATKPRKKITRWLDEHLAIWERLE